MNNEMAYLLGIILGNGEIQKGTKETTVTIDIFKFDKMVGNLGVNVSMCSVYMEWNSFSNTVKEL